MFVTNILVLNIFAAKNTVHIRYTRKTADQNLEAYSAHTKDGKDGVIKDPKRNLSLSNIRTLFKHKSSGILSYGDIFRFLFMIFLLLA